MFDKKKHVPQKRIDCLIGAGTIVHGDISFSGGLRIDGKVEGNVTAAAEGSATLVVSEQARVNGDINVSHVVINGAVNGQIKAKDYLELQARARVAGDVDYRTLEMHLGAVVKGRLNHAEPESAAVVELKRASAE
jgi:cytoskeletal protein CcmA (bactofilin family)